MALQSLYDSLPLRHIRVLKVEAARDPQVPIRAELFTVDLGEEQRPRFSALSYVWGSSGDKNHFILCNSGIKVPILPNAYSALQHLRDKLGTFTIWIDAVCISQDDEGEKEQQIPLMGEIYAKSDFVYVWLGAGSKSSQRAMQYLRNPPFFEYFLAIDTEKDQLSPPKYRPAVFKYIYESLGFQNTMFPSKAVSLVKSNTRGNGNVNCEEIRSLLDSQWLERMWTYQEIIFASNPIVVCGNDHLEWQIFAYGIAFLEYTGYFHLESQFQPLVGWVKLALAREYIHDQSLGAACNNSLLKDRKQRSPIQSYTDFLCNMVIYEQNWITNYLFIPIVVLILLLVVGLSLVALLTNTEDQESASKYNNQASSMANNILPNIYGGYNTAFETHQRQVLTKTATLSPTACASAQQTPAVTSVLDALAAIHSLGSGKPTSIINCAIDATSAADVSRADSCQLKCSQRINPPQCLKSCIYSAIAMPTSQPIMYEDAETKSPGCRRAIIITSSIVTICLVILMGAAAMLEVFKWRTRTLLKNRPSLVEVDLVDALLFRKAKLDHDKAFALRNVLQLLSESAIPHPDYSQPLHQTYADLNIRLYRILGLSSLLTAAAIMPLADYPGWMADWSKNPDMFWLANSSLYRRPVAQKDQSVDKLNYSNHEIDPKRAPLQNYPTVTCQATVLCRIHNFLEFHKIQSLDDISGHKKNFQAWMTMAKSSKNMLRFGNEWTSNLQALLSIGAPLVSQKKISCWVDFLMKNNNDPDESFRGLCQSTDLLEIQLNICNQFSDPRRKLFWYTPQMQSDDPGWLVAEHGFLTRLHGDGASSQITGEGRPWREYVLGICTHLCSDNDALIHIDGASRPVIVSLHDSDSDCPESRISARLRSPAIIRTDRSQVEKRTLTFS